MYLTLENFLISAEMKNNIEVKGMGKKIMIIDDSVTMRTVVRTALKLEGFDVIEAEDGEDGIAKMKSEDVDLFICDVNMPKMDGITFVKKVKEMSNYRHIPMIMLTTEGGSDKMEEGKAAGAKAWMVKPFKHEKLIEAVKKLVPSA